MKNEELKQQIDDYCSSYYDKNFMSLTTDHFKSPDSCLATRMANPEIFRRQLSSGFSARIDRKYFDEKLPAESYSIEDYSKLFFKNIEIIKQTRDETCYSYNSDGNLIRRNPMDLRYEYPEYYNTPLQLGVTYNNPASFVSVKPSDFNNLVTVEKNKREADEMLANNLTNDALKVYMALVPNSALIKNAPLVMKGIENNKKELLEKHPEEEEKIEGETNNLLCALQYISHMSLEEIERCGEVQNHEISEEIANDNQDTLVNCEQGNQDEKQDILGHFYANAEKINNLHSEVSKKLENSLSINDGTSEQTNLESPFTPN